MYKPNVPVVIVAGMEQNSRAIGRENGLLWHVKEDMQRFKRLTLGHPVIMGRKTFESIVEILGKPLPGRTNIVVTRNPEYAHDGATTATSLEEALQIAESEHPTEIHIGGGSQLYEQALPLVSRLNLTLFDDPEVIGDVFFPSYETEFVEVAREEHTTDDGLQYAWVDFERTVL